MGIPNQKLIDFLSAETMKGKRHRKSSYYACLNDARQITNRDVATGKLLAGGKHDGWPGVLCYLILIEHIGELWGKQSCSTKEFLWTLEKFTTLTADERDALWALRNAFLHSYGLFNDKKPKHLFQLVANSAKIIHLPTVPWNGDLANRTASDQTIIDVVLLGDLVENIHAQLLGAAFAGTLSLPPNYENYVMSC